MDKLVGLIILGVVALLLALVLFTPFGAAVDYAEGGLKVAARVAGAEITLLPKPEKKPQKGKKPSKKPQKAKKAGAEGEKKAKKPKKPKPPLVTKEMLPELIGLAGGAIKRFGRRITVNRFVLHLSFGGAVDPYSAVMSYGAVNSALGTLGTAARESVKPRKTDVQTSVDFESERTEAVFGLTVTLNLAKILAVGAWALFGFLRIKRRADKASAKERKEHNGTDADPDGGLSQDQPC